MLQIDDAAVEALRDMGAIRISAEEVDGQIELAIDEAAEPSTGDEVIERDGARIFVDGLAAEVLVDQVLGVEAHGDHYHFTFDDQPA